MPRKTGYKTQGASSTLRLGDPDLGTSVWHTEYDIEFTAATRVEERNREDVAQQSARAALRTPRSLKKGYVSGQDYEKLDAQYSEALLAYRELQAQVGVLEQRLASMHGNEHMLLRAVEDQHGLIETLRQQVSAMTDNLGLLLGGVERNKSILALMTHAQEPSPHKPARANEEARVSPRSGECAQASHDFESMSARLSALESRIGDMADAVTALSRAQTLMASRAFVPAARASTWREGPPSARRRSSNGRESSKSRESNSGRRHVAEKIERLPNPLQIPSRNSTWKP